MTSRIPVIAPRRTAAKPTDGSMTSAAPATSIAAKSTIGSRGADAKTAGGSAITSAAPATSIAAKSTIGSRGADAKMTGGSAITSAAPATSIAAKSTIGTRGADAKMTGGSAITSAAPMTSIAAKSANRQLPAQRAAKPDFAILAEIKPDAKLLVPLLHKPRATHTQKNPFRFEIKSRHQHRATDDWDTMCEAADLNRNQLYLKLSAMSTYLRKQPDNWRRLVDAIGLKGSERKAFKDKLAQYGLAPIQPEATYFDDDEDISTRTDATVGRYELRRGRSGFATGPGEDASSASGGTATSGRQAGPATAAVVGGSNEADSAGADDDEGSKSFGRGEDLKCDGKCMATISDLRCEIQQLWQHLEQLELTFKLYAKTHS